MLSWEQKRAHQVITLQQLEVDVEILFENPSDSKSVVLLCHPHPLYEGTMYNKVVASMAKGALRANVAVLRFNFPGVGQSTGRFDDGKLEQQVTSCLLENLSKHFQHLILGGFSFGGAIAAASYDNPIDLRLLIAPAMRFLSTEVQFEKPALIIHSFDDPIVSIDDSLSIAQSHKESGLLTTYFLADSGHFFPNNLFLIEQHIQRYLEQYSKEHNENKTIDGEKPS